MSFFIGLVMGCLVFSIVSAALDALRAELTAPKSEYQKWLEEAKRNSVIESRST